MSINTKKIIAILCMGGVVLSSTPMVHAEAINANISKSESANLDESYLDKEFISLVPHAKKVDVDYNEALSKVVNEDSRDYDLYKEVVKDIYSLDGTKGINEYSNTSVSIYYYSNDNMIEVNNMSINLSKFEEDRCWGLSRMINSYSIWMPKSKDSDHTICIDCTKNGDKYTIEEYDLVDLINEDRKSVKYEVKEKQYNSLVLDYMNAYSNDQYYDSLKNYKTK